METTTSTASAYTKGPWERTNGRNPEGCLSIYDTGGTTGTFNRIAIVEARAEDEANAHLLAAAPRLLTALEKLLDVPELNMDDLEPGTVKALQQAQEAVSEAYGLAA